MPTSMHRQPPCAAWLPWRSLLTLLVGCILQACTSLPAVHRGPASAALAASPETELGRLAASSVTGSIESGFRPLPLGALAMDARLALIERAQRSLDLQYYLLQSDVTGHTLLRAVRDAVQRGVRVRLLVDDLYTADSRQMLQALAAYPHVEVRLFNPFAAGRAFAATRWGLALLDLARLNHRMHNKLFIADGAFAIAGGRNIADEYFARSDQLNFLDFDLLIAGAAVPRLAATFDSYWNSARVYPLQALEPPAASAAELRDQFEQLSADAVGAYPTPEPQAAGPLGWLPLSADLQHPPLKLLKGHAEVFADDPEKVSGRSERGDDPTTVTARVGAALNDARFEWVMVSPYFVPSDLAMADIGAARARGVRVEVMTNSLASNDEPFASAAYGRHRKALLKMGVQLYETDAGLLGQDPLFRASASHLFGRSHAKLLVIDRHLVYVGSMNLDLRSSRINTELGMLVDSAALARQVLALADTVSTRASYRLQLDATGDKLQWVLGHAGDEKVFDAEPAFDTATWLELLLFSPLVSDSLL